MTIGKLFGHQKGKIWWLLPLVLALGWGVWYFFLRTLAPWEAAPSAAGVAVVWPAPSPLQEVPGAVRWSGWAEAVAAVAQVYQAGGLTPVEPTLWVGQASGASDMHVLGIFAVGRGWLPPDSLRRQDEEFEGRRLGLTMLADGRKVYHLQHRGLWMVSEYPYLLTDALAEARRWRGGWRELRQAAAGAPSFHWRLPALGPWWKTTAPEAYRRGWPLVGQFVQLGARQDTGGGDWLLEAWGSAFEAPPAQSWDYVAGPFGAAWAQPAPAPGGAAGWWERELAPGLAGSPLAVDYAGEALWIVAAASARQAEQWYQQWTQAGVGVSQPYLTFTLAEVTEPALWAALAGQAQAGAWITQVDATLVVAGSRALLERWADYYLVGATLAADTSWASVLAAQDGGMPGELLAVVHGPRLRAGHTAAEALAPDWLTHHTWWGLSRVDAAHLRWWGRGGGATTPPVGARLAWRHELPDEPRVCLPVWALEGKSHREVAVQTHDGQLYLFDPQGRLRWRTPVGGAVQSDVYCLQQAGTQQAVYVFNTIDRVVAVDDAGQTLPQYGRLLPAPAAGGITLIDSSGVGGYIYYVPLVDGSLWGFTLAGAPLAGWDPHGRRLPTRLPLRHYQFPQYDFIVAQDTLGGLHTFGRKGEPRFGFTDSLAVWLGPWQAELTGDLRTSRLVACRTDGKLTVVNFQGEGFPLRLGEGRAATLGFVLADVRADQRAEYLAHRPGHIDVYGYEGAGFALRQTLLLPTSVAADTVGALGWPGQPAALYAFSRRRAELHAWLPNQGWVAEPLAADQPPVLLRLPDGQPAWVTVFRGGVYAYRW